MVFCLVFVSILSEFSLAGIVPFGTVITWAYIVMGLEGSLENAISMGLSVPNALKRAIRNIAETHGAKNEFNEEGKKDPPNLKGWVTKNNCALTAFYNKNAAN